MKLTKKKAIEITVELWTFLAETGDEKGAWGGWETYGQMIYGCPLCEYSHHCLNWGRGRCGSCPYYKKFGCCYGDEEDTIYSLWEEAHTPRTRKKYAKLFLEQLKQL